MKVGIDVGGTFTDFLVTDEQGRAQVGKVLSTPEDPWIGLLQGLEELAQERGQGLARTSVLRRYERWRRGENALVLQTMKGFKSLFGSGSPMLTGLRRAGLDAADSIAPLKHQLARYAMGISGDIPAICRPEI